MAVKLLVVDDSATIQKVIKIAFSRHQVQVTAVNTVVEAVAALRRENAEVLIIDAGLPGIDEAGDFQKIVQESADAKVLMLLGSYESIDEQELIAAGFEQFLRKPFESGDIIAKVKDMLGVDLPLRQTVPPQPPPVKFAETQPPKMPPPPPVADDQIGKTLPPPPPPPPPRPPQDAGERQFYSEATQTKPNTFTRDEPTRSTVNLPPPPESTVTADLPPLPFTEPTNITPPPPPPPPVRRTDTDDAQRWQTREVAVAASPPQDRLQTEIEHPPPPPLTDEARKGRPAFSLADFQASQANQPEVVQQASSRDSVFTEAGDLIGEKPYQQATETTSPEVKGPDPVKPAMESFKPSIKEVRAEIERYVQKELDGLVKKLLQEYCEAHFDQLARDVIQAELRRLADEKARHLVDG